MSEKTQKEKIFKEVEIDPFNQPPLEIYKCPTCKLPAEDKCMCGHLICKNGHEFNEKGKILHH